MRERGWRTVRGMEGMGERLSKDRDGEREMGPGIKVREGEERRR